MKEPRRKLPVALADILGIQQVRPGTCPVELGDRARHTSGVPFVGKVVAIHKEHSCVTLSRPTGRLTVCWAFVEKVGR